MQYTKLGNTGISVSRICFGCMSYGGGEMPPWSMQRDWALDADQAREHFAIALESGINFFDTADVYSNGGSEEITGRWLGEMASRDDIVRCDQGARGDGPGAEQARTQPQAHDRGVREFLAAAQDGLHRPLSDPSMGLHDADRRDARRARLLGARG